MRANRHSLSRQRGMSLVMSLIVVGALILMGVSAVMVANTQFKVAGNLQYQNIAMSDAESALAVAENWLPTNFANQAFAQTGTPGLYPTGTAPDPASMTWDDTNSIKVDAAGNQRYMIELYLAGRTLPSNSVLQCSNYGTNAPCPKVNVYRVTTRGVSRLGATRVVQSLFAVRTAN